MTDFIKTGRSQAKVRVTLTNGGPDAFMPDIYGDYIIVERTIKDKGGGYKIMNERGWFLNNIAWLMFPIFKVIIYFTFRHFDF